MEETIHSASANSSYRAYILKKIYTLSLLIFFINISSFTNGFSNNISHPTILTNNDVTGNDIVNWLHLEKCVPVNKNYTTELDNNSELFPDNVDLNCQDFVVDLVENCLNSGIDLSVSGGTTPYSYAWSDMPMPDAHWNFENTTDDISGNGNNQNVAPSLGTPAYSADVVEGQSSLLLDGSTYVRYSINSNFMEIAFTEWMISTWIKPTSLSGTQTIIDEGGATNGISVRLNGATLQFAARDNGVQVNAGTHTFPNDGAWHHVTAVYANDSLSLYLDGVKGTSAYTGYVNGEISAHSGNGGIGYYDGGSGFGSGSGSYFTGLMDDFKYYYNQSLTANQIADVASNNGSRSNLAAGTYSVTISDADGVCTTVESQLVDGACEEICDNGIDDDNDGIEDEMTFSNPYPGFPIDFLNNNAGWLDYELSSDINFVDNEDGTLSITGSLENGTPVDFGSGSNQSSCGVTDGWNITLTLSDRMNWTQWQAAGGSANVNGSCTGSESILDFWDVTGTLTGLGCNAGRTISITGPKAPYRFQIGNGGNSGDNTCAFGMSTWFDLNEGGVDYNADIYAFMDASCYDPTCTISGDVISAMGDVRNGAASNAEGAPDDVTTEVGASSDYLVVTFEDELPIGSNYTIYISGRGGSATTDVWEAPIGTTLPSSQQNTPAGFTFNGQASGPEDIVTPVVKTTIVPTKYIYFDRGSGDIEIDAVTYTILCPEPEPCINEISISNISVSACRE